MPMSRRHESASCASRADGDESGEGREQCSTASPAAPCSASSPSSLAAAPETVLPALPSDGSLAPLPPRDGPVGLHAFFCGFAAGDEMTGLVQTLRRTMLSNFSRLRRASAEDADTPLATAAAGAVVESDGCPLSSSGGGSLRKATKAAMLFSMEHPAAAEEATFLFFAPSTRASLEKAADSIGSVEGRGRCVFPIRGARLRALLSDRAAATLAKRYLKEKHDVEAALEVLSEVEPTPPVAALLIECYAKKGEWEKARDSLWAIPPSHWTELDVSLTIRAMYHAALAAKKTTSSSSPLTCRNMWTEVLRVLRAAREGGGPTWGSPATINDALGLLSLDARMWPRAVALLDTVFAPPTTVTPANAHARSHTEATTSSFRSSASTARKGVAPTRTRRRDGSGEVQTFYPNPADDRHDGLVASPVSGERLDLASEPITPVAGMGAALGASTAALASSHLLTRPAAATHGPAATATRGTMQLLRPNAITVYQTCRALRARPDLALRYATHLIEAYRVAVTTDFKATEVLLRTCIHEGDWEAALSLLDNEPAPDARVFSADIVVSLLKLLGERHAAEHCAAVLSRLVATSSYPSSGENGVPGRELSKFYNQNTLSRAYNTMIQHATSLDAAEAFFKELRSVTGAPARRADAPNVRDGKVDPQCDDACLENESYEKLAMLYSEAGDWERALGCLHTLLHHPRRRWLYVPTTTVHDAVQYALEQSARQQPPPFPGAAVQASPMASPHIPRPGEGLPPPPSCDSASAAAAAAAAAVARRTTGALTGAPWQLSVALFRDMCDRGVPTSTIAFQSVVKRCFAQGASEEAQKLFQLLMQRGVRR